MNQHIIETNGSVDATALLAALEAAGIDAQVKPLHLQRAAKVAAAIVDAVCRRLAPVFVSRWC